MASTDIRGYEWNEKGTHTVSFSHSLSSQNLVSVFPEHPFHSESGSISKRKVNEFLLIDNFATCLNKTFAGMKQWAKLGNSAVSIPFRYPSVKSLFPAATGTELFRSLVQTFSLILLFLLFAHDYEAAAGENLRNNRHPESMSRFPRSLFSFHRTPLDTDIMMLSLLWYHRLPDPLPAITTNTGSSVFFLPTIDRFLPLLLYLFGWIVCFTKFQMSVRVLVLSLLIPSDV